jgi:hypothetical protein
MTNSFTKKNLAILDYKFDFLSATNSGSPSNPELSDWLQSGETISSYVMSASALNSASLISIIDDYLSDSNTSVTVWIGGGDIFGNYTVNCKISTSSSPIAREDEKTIYIKVID